MTHTPGPWHVEWAMAHGGEAHHICDSRDQAGFSVIATVHFHDDDEGETKANAMLMAAAPAMALAINNLLDHPGEEWAIKQARYVMNKAMGRSPGPSEEDFLAALGPCGK